MAAGRPGGLKRLFLQGVRIASNRSCVLHESVILLRPRKTAQGDIVHNDDTTVKILEMMGERAQQAALTEDIEGCLSVVLKALKKSDLPRGEKLAWCAEMAKRDHVGFVCDHELQAMRSHFKASQS